MKKIIVVGAFLLAVIVSVLSPKQIAKKSNGENSSVNGIFRGVDSQLPLCESEKTDVNVMPFIGQPLQFDANEISNSNGEVAQCENREAKLKYCTANRINNDTTNEGVKEIKSLAVKDGNTVGEVRLYGKGETFVTDVYIDVKFDGASPYSITLVDGYSPDIQTFDFGADEKLLFFSSQTGGSGGYGNYRIYRLYTTEYKLLYDDKIDSKTTFFDAKFLDGGFMRITDVNSNLTVDVKYMQKDFYDQIFAKDGSVVGEQPSINYVSFVSPSFNPASGVYRLLTYRSVVAVAEVNRLGYIVQTLDWTENGFVSRFNEFAIEI